jgi:hypothetical protein
VDAEQRATLYRVAMAGGAAIVAASNTDGWESVKARFVTVLGHGHRGREQVQAELLEETNQAISHAPEGLLDQVTHDQIGRAQQLLLQAMIVDSSVADKLQTLLVELYPPPEPEEPPPPPPRPSIAGRPLGQRWL